MCHEYNNLCICNILNIYLSVRYTIAFIYKINLECYKLNILNRKRPPGSYLLAKSNTVVFMEDNKNTI